MNINRIGATVYLNGTRLDCTHKGKPSVTGAIRVEKKLKLVEDLGGFFAVASTVDRQTIQGRRLVSRRALDLLQQAEDAK